MNVIFLNHAVLGTAGFIAFAVFVGLIMLFAERPKREALKQLALRFEGSVSPFTGSAKGKFQGFEFSVSLIAAGKNTPPRLIIRFLKQFSFNLRIYRETPFSRLGKRLGLVREVQINDPSFDSQFLIFSNRPVQAVNFLSMNTKGVLQGLFADGFDSFSLNSRGLALQKPDYVLQADLAPEKIEQILRKILSIAGGTA
jgi:hypothetical protein